MKRIWHWFEHRMGWNHGALVFISTEVSELTVGHMCDGCGLITGVIDVEIDALLPKEIRLEASK